jgi:hypothetical protein
MFIGLALLALTTSFLELSTRLSSLNGVEFSGDLAEFSRETDEEVFVILSIALALTLAALSFPAGIFVAPFQVSPRFLLRTQGVTTSRLLGTCATNDIQNENGGQRDREERLHLGKLVTSALQRKPN